MSAASGTARPASRSVLGSLISVVSGVTVAGSVFAPGWEVLFAAGFMLVRGTPWSAKGVVVFIVEFMGSMCARVDLQAFAWETGRCKAQM